MANRSYDKLKMERDQLKERLEEFERRISGDSNEKEEVIKLPKSLAELLSQRQGISIGDLLADMISDIQGNILVRFTMGGQSESYDMPEVYWDYIKKLGNGDAEKGIDILVKRYREARS